MYLKRYQPAVMCFLFLSGLISCSSRKYIEELPYLDSSEHYTREMDELKSSDEAGVSLPDQQDKKSDDEEMEIRERYSIIMGVMPKNVINYKLYAFIDNWIRPGIKEQIPDQKDATDCAQFISLLFNEVYQETLSVSPEKVFRSKALELFTGRTFLQEGDILFFRYDKQHPISDEGIYLQNNRIIACTKRGVSIYNFNDPYFQLRYVAAGRLKPKS